MKRRRHQKYIVGVDEVGRGPLAGPVAVGVLAATPKMLRKFRTIKESKQLSPKSREEWYQQIYLSRGEELRFAASFVAAKIIDEKGIVLAIRLALARSLSKLGVSADSCEVLLDGGLKAPKKYIHQKTIIGGDAKETVIAMASVVAKVLRDKRMAILGEKYPKYGFATHKGYGTKAHYHAIKKYGLSTEHRRSFCSRVAIK